jgi:hypothetical protein
MEKLLPRLISIFIFTIGFLILGNSQELYGQTFRNKNETELKFPDLTHTDLDFKLETKGFKQFTIELNQEPSVPTRIKIYDVIGNLILEDQIKPSDGKRKKFDFSKVNSPLFVVEVGNAKYNKTKSIYAQPAGRRSQGK